MSLDSGRAVDGSVEGGENGSAPAGVLGGRESRSISTASMGLVVGSGGTSRGSIGVRRSRGRGREGALEVGMGFLMSDLMSDLLSDIDGFAFFGERMGSVFTDSETCQYQMYEETGKRRTISEDSPICCI